MLYRKQPKLADLIDTTPPELTEKEQAFATEVARNVDDADYYDAAPFSQVLAESKAKQGRAPSAKVTRNVDEHEAAAVGHPCVMDLADDIRAKEAGDVLSWLNENGCLQFGALTKALAAIQAGAHRKR